jgi:hypothetical protein
MAAVPVETRRRAAQHLESVRETEMGVKARRARLGDEVAIVFRPDLDDVAYYEFEVDLRATRSTRVATRAGRAAETGLAELMGDGEASSVGARGFIVVSAGAHDHPVPHWSFDTEPVARRLESLAAAGGKEVARIYRLDALSYVGEDDDGQLVGQLGPIPIPMDGGPADLEQARGRITSMIAAASSKVDDKELPADAEHVVTRRGPKPPRRKFRKIGSWAELRDSYADSFGPFLTDLTRRAAEVWKIDALVAEFGEGIIVGRPHRVALLESEAAVDLSGEAAAYVAAEIIEKPGVPPVLELVAARSPFDREADFEVTIAYASGLTERLGFFMVAPDSKSRKRSSTTDTKGSDT